jgi:hypothetical protein
MLAGTLRVAATGFRFSREAVVVFMAVVIFMVAVFIMENSNTSHKRCNL